VSNGGNFHEPPGFAEEHSESFSKAFGRQVADQESPSLRVLSPEEIATDCVPEPIIEGFIYKSSTHLLTAGAKIGKSILGTQMGASVAGGTTFLGLAVQKTRTLLLSLEMRASIVRERLASLKDDLELEIPDYERELLICAAASGYVPKLNLLDQSAVRCFESLIREAGIEFVILDTFYRFIPGADPNDNREMGHVFGILNNIASRTGSGILILDHVRKGGQSGSVSHSALGAVTKGGASNVIISLERKSQSEQGHWQINVESHYGSWAKPLSYTRPLRDDGSVGFGCIRCGSSAHLKITEAQIKQVFFAQEKRDERNRPYFDSQNKLTRALQVAGLAPTSSSSGASEVMKAIKSDFAEWEGRHDDGATLEQKPIVMEKGGSRGAIRFTWNNLNRPGQPE
jgi:hypothetical protein